MLYGALSASLPDIDFVASFWLKTPYDLLAHRGLTHSFLFAFVVTITLTFVIRNRTSLEKIPTKIWLIFIGTEILVHLFLDVFNTYGTGLFEPFSHYRVSWNTIFVADPFFSIWPIFAAVVLLILNKYSNHRKGWAIFGLVLSSLYLFYCISNKLRIDNQSRIAFKHQNIIVDHYFTTPTPFNNWLWYIVAQTDSGYYIGYRSVFDRADQISFRFFPGNSSLLKSFSKHKDYQELVRFSQGYYTASLSRQGVLFNDLRFGQMQGWRNPEANFVFHYYLQAPDENLLVVQRGRVANWNIESVGFLWRRIKGE